MYESKGNSIRLSKHTGDSALSCSTVAKWTSEFKFGRESLDVFGVVDGPKVLLPQIIAKVHKMDMEARRQKVRETAKAEGMSSE